jgi:DinB superfamily
MDDLSYPVGRFEAPKAPLTERERSDLIGHIAEAPGALRSAFAGLSAEQLDTPYRPGGWTARQVAHHVPDSHMNAYVRFRLALTEKEPTIRPYDQTSWAELHEAKTAPPDLSLDLLEALHRRWVTLLRQLTPEEWPRRFRHPEHAGIQDLDWMLAMYAWHGRHHTAHVTSLRRRMGW